MVLERARGGGGRCATRRLEGQAFDFGPTFLHGRDPEFLAALDAVPASHLPGWPAVVEGVGQPCQPDAFTPGERRLAFTEGVVAFPRFLSGGLDLRLGHDIKRLEPAGGQVLLETAKGEEHQSPSGPGATWEARWVGKWNEGTYFDLGTAVQSIDRFDDHTLVVSRVLSDAGVEVGLVCEP